MTDTNLIHELARVALSVLATALGVLATYYVPRTFRAIERRLGVDLPAPLEAEAERVALEAISYAEEKARGLAKRAGERVLSTDKLDWAAAYFREHASAQVLTWLSDHVETWLQAKLGLLRLSEPARLAPPLRAPLDPGGPLGPLAPGVLLEPRELATATPGPSTPGAR